MKIRVTGWSFAVAAAFAAAPGQAQNVSGGASVPFAQAGAPIPFTFSSPLSPALTPAVPGFTESPVAPYGKLATPITTPAAPIIAVRPTTLVPNGVLRSNGAILAPGTSLVTVVPGQAFPTLGVADLESPFSSKSTIDARNGNDRNRPQARGSSNGVQARQRRTTRPDPAERDDRNLVAVPAQPSDSTEAAGNEGDAANDLDAASARDRRRDATMSIDTLIERLGNPTTVIYQDGGQVLFFNGGIRVFVRDGVIQ